MLNRLFSNDEDVDDPLPPAFDRASDPDPDEDAASIRRAVTELGSLPVEQRRFLAGYAYVLVRVARADADISRVETESMEQAVVAAGGLPSSLGALLVALATRLNSLYGATEDYTVTRELARSSSPQQRQRLLRACVAVAVADGAITSGEAVELNEVGREMGFSVDEIEAIRAQVDPHWAERTGPTDQDSRSDEVGGQRETL